MESKIKETLKQIVTTDGKRLKIIVSIGLIGIVLIFASEMLSGDKKDDKAEGTSSINYNEYTDKLEKRLTDVISSIDGVGECNVMITLENTTESVYAKNSEARNDENSTNQKNEYVFYELKGDETPVLIKEYLPKVQGVTVVCSGGDDIAVKEKIIDSVTSLFNIPTNRVSVSKIKAQR